MKSTLGHWLTRLGTLSARPSAFGILVVFAIVWGLMEPESLDWHGAATLITLIMTLFIQRSEHRDTQAIHAKLDEILHVNAQAETSLTRLDEREPEEIEHYRKQARAGD
jgi:low affinity Fe/Cu permease